jgi:cytochrome b subunit of formate dehydrogenase
VAGKPDALCATCHETETSQMAASIHAMARGDGKRNLPSCTTCHTAHAVKSHQDPTSPTNRTRIHETCATCHADPKVIAEERIARPRVIPLFEQSIHGRAIRQGRVEAATCTDCHRAHEIRRGTDPASSIFKANVAATCGQCHGRVAEQFRASVHGMAVSRGVFAAPTCTDCHGEHTIAGTREPGSRVSPLMVSKTCAACHEAVPVVEEFGLATRRGTTFFDSFHGLAVRGGSTVAANCASCHGTHNISPSSDPRSTIHPANLPETCGQCHPGAGAQLASAKIHVGPGIGEHPLVTLVRRFYLVLIVAAIGGMAVHNGLDFLKRVRERWQVDMRGIPPEEPHTPPEVNTRLFERLTVNERIQHLILLLSFIILVITGFALKFPESWWARPLVWIEGGYALRAWTHRVAGAILTLAGIYHLGYLFGTSRGRSQFSAMIPRWQDVRDAGGLIAYNLGWRSSRPRFHRFSYVEKLEYWAVIWGTFVMAATGFLMWFQTTVLRRWPLWSIDLATVIHYYEAWLATLAILVWHFYSVIFRPDVYPMSWVWISGKLTGKQMAEEHPAEIDEILQAERSMEESPAGGR